MLSLFTNVSRLRPSKHAVEKPFFWAYVEFSSSDFNVQGDTLSTEGDALTPIIDITTHLIRLFLKILGIYFFQLFSIMSMA